MEPIPQQRTQRYASFRRQHPAWQLLVARRAPLILGCLQTLFEQANDGVPMEEAQQSLAQMLSAYASEDEYDIDGSDTPLLAGRELRSWIKRKLVVERGGRIYATDALEMATQFVESLDNRLMTSTASRLSVVQREIENLETGLNPNPVSRIASLRRRIKSLEQELSEAEAGHVPVLDEVQAIEGIREVFNLATSLRADFRRVEDSWRDADRALRQSIISEQYHRGEIVDRLLEGHDELLNTQEGRVFDSFQQQLRQTIELEQMRERLRTICKHPVTAQALNRAQQNDLRWLVMWLVKETQAVLQARARSEKDVKGFLKTGLAAEHHRVGNLLSEIMGLALKMDWQRQAVRRLPTPLPPVAIATSGLPLIERLNFKSIETDITDELNLDNRGTDLSEIDEDFWEAFDGLDRTVLINDTLELLAQEKKPMSIAELSKKMPPVHDLETFALWLGMAREAGTPVLEDRPETIEITDDENIHWRFTIPYAGLSHEDLADIDWEAQ